MNKKIERFTKKVRYYAKYRPSYPEIMMQYLSVSGILADTKIIADIGSGTGILSKLFLDNGNIVYGIEPNQAMRKASKMHLKNYQQFYPMDSFAEATSLKNQSVDIIVAGTSFHWFNITKTKVEFKRILKPSGWVILIWNIKNIVQPGLMYDYNDLVLRYKPKRSKKKISEILRFFFIPNKVKIKSFENNQYLTWNGFKGTFLSTSYTLNYSEEGYEDALRQLKIIFNRYKQNGIVKFLYNTVLYYGHFQ